MCSTVITVASKRSVQLQCGPMVDSTSRPSRDANTCFFARGLWSSMAMTRASWDSSSHDGHGSLSALQLDGTGCNPRAFKTKPNATPSYLVDDVVPRSERLAAERAGASDAPHAALGLGRKMSPAQCSQHRRVTVTSPSSLSSMTRVSIKCDGACFSQCAVHSRSQKPSRPGKHGHYCAAAQGGALRDHRGRRGRGRDLRGAGTAATRAHPAAEAQQQGGSGAGLLLHLLLY
ncbi:hypothetical protein ON010_g4385 [Phytophthora cinnamomi]|nr:hypothetical protein ON010_g4385 [Phytophthora cinnamomi]